MLTRRSFLVFSTTALAGCTTVQTSNLQANGLKQYKRVYIEPLQDDEFQVVTALSIELSDMGFELSGEPFSNPADTDLNVKITAIGGWDMSRYLQSVQFQFTASKSARIVTVSSFYSKGVWLGIRDARLKAIFNDLRQKNGYPPSRQFSLVRHENAA